jgi:plasmid stabilization system protein ParE
MKSGKSMDYKLFWTEEAIRNLEEIFDYLIDTWSQKEVDGQPNLFKTKTIGLNYQ